jgi:hypothetical protein
MRPWITLKNLGVLPLSIQKLSKSPRYFVERTTFRRMNGSITHTYPILDDYKDSAGVAGGHYFHQDLVVAQYIYKDKPIRHIDVGSRIDGFVAHVASFRKIEILDIRKMPNSIHPNIEYTQSDLMVGAAIGKTDSLSCLHTIEHFGLGRYGDSVDPKGYLKGFDKLIDMLETNGIFYVSFPIGRRNEVHFNAHRVFHPLDVFTWAPAKLEFIRFDYVDDAGEFHSDFDVLNSDLKVTYGCGVYTFKKK